MVGSGSFLAAAHHIVLGLELWQTEGGSFGGDMGEYPANSSDNGLSKVLVSEPEEGIGAVR